jgi:NitT/TauT family transport system permease protein
MSSITGKKVPRFLWSILGTLIFIGLWELASLIQGSNLILPGPLLVLKRFIVLLGSPRFVRAVSATFLRVIFGILISSVLGIIAGLACGLNKRIAAMLKPFLIVISATPVMSVILIAFLWFGQERTPVFTAFLMVFPVMAANVTEGIQAVDGGLKELFAVYGISRRETLRSLYLPAVMPFILGGLWSGLSLCWKVVVAAEVLVQPVRALGTGMVLAKSQLETAELFAWTTGTVLAAAITQLLLRFLLSRLKRTKA